jgi:HD-GYP domain-containing protein (c-di-GMP phosphodiesterase class II)
MAISQIQISVSDLTLGMYVSRLDRPWKNTPFPLQGFYVRASEDIASLKSYCDHVYIDVIKGRGLLESAGVVSPRGDRRAQLRPASPDRRQTSRDLQVGEDCPPINVRKGIYDVTVSLRVEVEQAKHLVRDLRANLSLVSRQIVRGKLEDYDKLKENVGGMVESVLRCPDAFIWLVRLRDKDQHTHDHSLRSALWAVQFARFIGMDKREISVLCLGTLLKDIGKTKLSNALLRKQNRTEEEDREYQQYVTYGVEMLRNTHNVEPRVISIVRYHAERNNGQGFPERISGTKIPLLARIAGIAATYDAISNPRESDKPAAPSRAVSLLYNMRGEEFQEDLVVQFIQSVGLYPTGTLVELTTGDIGVIVEQHPQSRLTPQVAILGQSADNLNDNIFLIDLKDEEKTREALSQTGGIGLQDVDRVAIARDLEPMGYDIDLSNVSSLFMNDSVEAKEGFWSSLRGKMGFDRLN